MTRSLRAPSTEPDGRAFRFCLEDFETLIVNSIKVTPPQNCYQTLKFGHVTVQIWTGVRSKGSMSSVASKLYLTFKGAFHELLLFRVENAFAGRNY